MHYAIFCPNCNAILIIFVSEHKKIISLLIYHCYLYAKGKKSVFYRENYCCRFAEDVIEIFATISTKKLVILHFAAVSRCNICEKNFCNKPTQKYFIIVINYFLSNHCSLLLLFELCFNNKFDTFL